ncbi:ADP-ribosylglycohydrolase family protein [Aureispira anguillae]|uniref:ADP-ribosylglycohydrolase family protein n=1 Tax=Aureispira anguillae TaxID=2864201 RepID=A0A915YC57_9BACT|nr:ADP-ribosylglycohydrolase family protein [Aureispira anguillae]BDS10383.1 ADP-ribosylglycohydrolase family protein [Aureispira anguillae]
MNLKSAILGLAVGDALGVPVEFMSREMLQKNPVKIMREFGTHKQPKGTWSDDSTMTFCLMETLAQGYDLRDLGDRFVRWYRQAYWTPYKNVFDMGNTTRQAIIRLETQQIEPTQAGGKDRQSNGNGSLMRILPLLFYTKELPINQRWKITRAVSALTHGHFVACFACFIYLEYARLLLEGHDKWKAYQLMLDLVNGFTTTQSFLEGDLHSFHRIFQAPKQLAQLPKNQINSGGYVIDSLEASFWCLLNGNNYSETVLSAVNLGRDTDTTGAITGGLAGILYGESGIPLTWISYLARLNDILDLIERLDDKLEAQ